jgi:hypothetical protein
MTYQTISEEIIKQAAELSGPESNFHIAIKYAEDYRQAGLNPVYYTDDSERMIFVTTEEKMNGTLFN